MTIIIRSEEKLYSRLAKLLPHVRNLCHVSHNCTFNITQLYTYIHIMSYNYSQIVTMGYNSDTWGIIVACESQLWHVWHNKTRVIHHSVTCNTIATRESVTTLNTCDGPGLCVRAGRGVDLSRRHGPGRQARLHQPGLQVHERLWYLSMYLSTNVSFSLCIFIFLSFYIFT